jgi:hypothetical protein
MDRLLVAAALLSATCAVSPRGKRDRPVATEGMGLSSWYDAMP